MASMAQTVSPKLRSILEGIGSALDQGRPIRVLRGGVVVADEPHLDHERMQSNEADRTQGSAARSRQGSPGWEGTARRSRSSGSLLQAGSGSLRDSFEEGLPHLQVSYPGTRIWDDEVGLWVVVPSFPVGIDGPQAALVAALPFFEVPKRRCWGYWRRDRNLKWIGPRHTNFPDASICAFADGATAWQPTDGLTRLFDLYSVWLLCHLHLEALHRWPGPQHSINSYYRLHEFLEGELCSCDSGRTYFECHRPQDLLEDQQLAKVAFQKCAGGDLVDRRVPQAVRQFAKSHFKNAPSLLSALS